MKKKIKPPIIKGIEHSVAPVVFTTAGMAAALGLGELTNHLFTIYSAVVASCGAYALHESDFYLRHSFFHEDPETPRGERRTLDAIIVSMLAVEAGAITLASALGPVTEQAQTFGTQLLYTGALLSAAYVGGSLLLRTYTAGKKVLPYFWKTIKKRTAFEKLVRFILLPAAGVTALLTYNTPLTVTLSHSPAELDTPLLQEEIYVPQSQFTIWPVTVQKEKWLVISCFSAIRERNGSGGQSYFGRHHGVDMTGPKGTPVVAVKDGDVEEFDPSWANLTLDHGEGLHTSYGHLSEVFVKEGEHVSAGQAIGKVGDIGCKGHPHLHFQVMDECMPKHIKTKYGDAVLDGAINPLHYFLSLDYRIAKNPGCEAQGGPLKFEEVYKQFENPKHVKVLNKKTLLSIIKAHGSYINAAARETSLPSKYIWALEAAESGGKDPLFKKGKKEASGPMQIVPSTGFEYDVCKDIRCLTGDDRNDPEKAILAGAQRYETAWHHYEGYSAQPVLAALAYNAGEPLIDKAIRATGKRNPSEQQVYAVLTPEFVGENAPQSWWDGKMTPEKKSAEIIDHGRRFQLYVSQYPALDLIVTKERSIQDMQE